MRYVLLSVMLLTGICRAQEPLPGLLKSTLDSTIQPALAPAVPRTSASLTSSSTPATPFDSARPPLQVLLVTGGCCHDYDRQKLILTRGISARANVRWTVVHQGGTTTDTAIPLYNDPGWADGFDLVVHNECFSDVKDLAFVDRILQPHRNGVPAILIHCAMHCYRTGDDRWFEFVGMQSPGHGPHYSYTADNLQPSHPIMQDFGPAFVAPKGELYHSMKVFPTATPLAQANRQEDGMPQVCVWTNDYHGTRVFGCTMGHYNETMAEPKYLDMMARAVLWATGRDIEKEFKPSTEVIDENIKALISVPIPDPQARPAAQRCCVEGNLALDKPVTASSTQSGNDESHLTDGRPDTRWCANGGQTQEWVTVDLGEPQHIRNLRVHWERRKGSAYRYTIDASPDAAQWKTVVDASSNEEPQGISAHVVDSPETRYLRITFLGCSTGGWGSIWEFEASADKLPDLPDSALGAEVAGAASLSDVRAPENFDVHLFASPPSVNYPVCLTAAATGEVFIGVDEQGSLGKEPGRGKVLRCVDTDGDGTADQINEFAKMDHPRGLIYDHGSLWVLHPPFLSVFRDADGDGTADSSEVLVTGISTEEVARRGADHTTNGIRMGIDGWIYIAVGDFGFHQAVGKDGSQLSLRGGGVVRVRPDGSELELYCQGLRNIVDIAIDPAMNIFTRDNTNDGGGWDIRLSHIFQTAHYGYPSLYKNFAEEIMPPLADYGGGSGCGVMSFQDARWPAPYQNILLTCDWGRSEVYAHDLPTNGPTFNARQETFLQLPRPTDIDADASGRMYVSSWKNGQFNYDGPNVGFVAMITPRQFVPRPVPHIAALNDHDLVDQLRHPSAVMRLHVQREILRRDDTATLTDELVALAGESTAPHASRVAALWTLKQVHGSQSHATLIAMLADATLRETCLRALSDRTSQLEPFQPQLFVQHLQDPDDRVKAAAIIGLGRAVGHAVDHHWQVKDQNGQQPVSDVVDQYAAPLLPLTTPQPPIPHVGPVGVTGQVKQDGQLLANSQVTFFGPSGSRTASTTAAGTFQLEGVASGTYTVTVSSETAVDQAENPGPPDPASAQPSDQQVDPQSDVAADDWRRPHPERVLSHLAIQALVRMKAVDTCLKARQGPARAGALRALQSMHHPQTVDGLFRALSTSYDPALRRDIWTALIRLYHREGDFTAESPGWWGTRPDTTGPYYDRQTWSESGRIANALRIALAEGDAELAHHIQQQLRRHVVHPEGLGETELAGASGTAEPEMPVQLPALDPSNPLQIANMALPTVMESVMALNGSPEAGHMLFRAQSCINCHTFANGQQPRGPHLVDIGKRYSTAELLESLLDPGKKIAQGFETWTFVLTDGRVLTGFVVLESAETVTIRQTDGLTREFPQQHVEERIKQEISMMPKGIVGNLTVQQMADLIAYLQSLH